VTEFLWGDKVRWRGAGPFGMIGPNNNWSPEYVEIRFPDGIAITVPVEQVTPWEDDGDGWTVDEDLVRCSFAPSYLFDLNHISGKCKGVHETPGRRTLEHHHSFNRCGCGEKHP
jgi:hypothetical protein